MHKPIKTAFQKISGNGRKAWQLCTAPFFDGLCCAHAGPAPTQAIAVSGAIFPAAVQTRSLLKPLRRSTIG
jgi:hypothetical protein